MITKKIWNSLNEETRQKIANVIFDNENDEYKSMMAKEWHHNLDDEHRNMFNKCTERGEEVIEVKVNISKN